MKLNKTLNFLLAFSTAFSMVSVASATEYTSQSDLVGESNFAKMPVAQMTYTNEEIGNSVNVFNLSKNIDNNTIQNMVNNVGAYVESDGGNIKTIDYSLIIQDDYSGYSRSGETSYQVDVMTSLPSEIEDTGNGQRNIDTDDADKKLFVKADGQLRIRWTRLSNGRVKVNELLGQVWVKSGTITQSSHYIKYGPSGQTDVGYTKVYGSGTSCNASASISPREYRNASATYTVKFKEDMVCMTMWVNTY